MKTVTHKILTVSAGLLLASAIHTFAIEGLQISVQCSNVVLSWPSAADETYIVQYRQTLNSTDSWTTLTDYFPATTGTNVTFFVHSNIVQHPNCGGGRSFGAMIARTSVSTAMTGPSLPPVPLAMPVNGSGAAVPLCLYPPGFDLSGFVILDPLTGISVNGSAYTIGAFSLTGSQLDGPQPLEGGGGSGSGNSMLEPETGFYRVVRDGAHLFGITNGMTLSAW